MVHIAKITENCAQIVKVLSIKSSEMVKISMKQLWNDEVSCQKVIYEVSNVFFPPLTLQKHQISKNGPTGPWIPDPLSQI